MAYRVPIWVRSLISCRPLSPPAENGFVFRASLVGPKARKIFEIKGFPKLKDSRNGFVW